MCHAGNLLILVVVAYIHVNISELSYIEQIKKYIVELYSK